MKEISVEPASLAQQLRLKRSQMMTVELEAIALRLFAEQGFGKVTVEDIAAEAGISARTFYRYFPAKEDVLQSRIEQRTDALRELLAARPVDEPPFASLRHALADEARGTDIVLLRRWIAVVQATPSVLNAAVGGFHLKLLAAIAEFLGARLGQSSDDLVPTMLAAATGGVIQATQIQWYFLGGDLADRVAEGVSVLESGIGTKLTRPTPSQRRVAARRR
jgi:AcrR family transcriptional regulator